MVSHELKTPLTVIMGALHTATTAGISEEEARGLLMDAVAGTESLAGIIENLLELSRSKANRLNLHTEMIDISAIVNRVIEKLKGKSNIHRLFINMPEQPLRVKVDPVRFERTLFNLVDNAIKYSPEGGEIRISAHRENNILLVCVSDQGPGISVEDQKKLFKSFEQLDKTDRRAIQGVGLGLKVCRTLVEAHGGRIWVESQPGAGSSFCFNLPV
jgi:signal transduction histidine kinase